MSAASVRSPVGFHEAHRQPAHVLAPASGALYRHFDRLVGHHKQYRRDELSAWVVRAYDRTVTPVAHRLESCRTPPFGRSVFCVRRRR